MKPSVPLGLFHLPGRGRTGQEMRSWGEGACVCWILSLEGLGDHQEGVFAFWGTTAEGPPEGRTGPFL